MSNTKNETESKKAAPVDKIRVGLVTVSIWKNTNDKGTFYNATVENRYRDGKGNFKSGHSYGIDETLALAKAADLAHTKMMGLRDAG